MDYIIEHKNKLFMILLIVIIGVLIILLIYKNEDGEVLAINEPVKEEVVADKVFVDIKGAVKKPGVYEVESNAKVIDVIELAGGLKKEASTKNINLSAKVSDEMVIYIFTKSELTKENTTSTVPFTTNVINYDKCITTTKSSETVSTTNSLVNINTASKEELMTLSGVGASKADAIIIYRNNTSFNTIEDLMNVSGIGESAYAKIKDYITV